MPSSHLILCHPLLLLPPIPPSIRLFSNESTLRMRWPKYWSFSFSIIPSKEIPGLMSFRMDWLDLLAVQGTLKNTSAEPICRAAVEMQTENRPVDIAGEGKVRCFEKLALKPVYYHMYVCVHAKLLQSFLTSCNPIDCSSPGSFVHGILHARILE